MNHSSLNHLSRGLGAFAAVDKNMSILQAAIFLAVAQNEGIEAEALAQKTGLGIPGINRATRQLGNYLTRVDGKCMERGLGLIETRPTDENLRSYTCHLAPAGKRLMMRLDGFSKKCCGHHKTADGAPEEKEPAGEGVF